MKLIWIDLETTGLNPREDNILEIAVAEADLLEPFKLFNMVSYVTHFPRFMHSELDPFIVDMHTKNGLLAECLSASRSISSLRNILLDIIPDMPKDDRPVLAGSTVHFDRSFLEEWMPEVTDRLSHRHFDVSAIKLFCQSLGMEKLPKAEAHRAKDDILESVAHARQCAEWLEQKSTCSKL